MQVAGVGGALGLSPDESLLVFFANDGLLRGVEAATGKSREPPLHSDDSDAETPAAVADKKPASIRAWAFAYNFTSVSVPSLYPGTNLLPTWSSKYGGPVQVKALQQLGVQVLKWVSGPRRDFEVKDYVDELDPSLIDGASLAAALPPGVEDSHDGYKFDGAGIDEWGTKNATVNAIAAAGYRAAKQRWPTLYIMAW